MSTGAYFRRGGALRALAWVIAALGAAVLVTVLFATRGAAIQKELKETGERIREKLPEMPAIPEVPGIPELPGPRPVRDPAGTDRPDSSAPPVGSGGSASEPAAPTVPEKRPEPAAPAGPVRTDQPAPQPAYTLKDPPPVAATNHRVVRGETLYSLAETYYEDGSLWRLIAEANGLKEPSDLREGMEITIPGRR